jgi:hypothetical protein
MLLPASRALATVKARKRCKIIRVCCLLLPQESYRHRRDGCLRPTWGQDLRDDDDGGTTQGVSCDTLTSIQASSFMSPESSLDLLLPLTACRLLGGAQSSTAPDAGLFLSSILAKVAGRGSADGEVAIGIRKRAADGEESK